MHYVPFSVIKSIHEQTHSAMPDAPVRPMSRGVAPPTPRRTTPAAARRRTRTRRRSRAGAESAPRAALTLVPRSCRSTSCAKLSSVIEVRRLRVLRALADHGTVTAAAEVLHLTPSAVSQQLAALESEVGQELLERRGRRVAITSAGRLLLAHTDTILTEVERAEDAMRLHANGATGEVRVTAFATAISLLVAPTLARLRETNPGLDLVVRDAEGHQGITQLLDGDADIAIAVEHRGSPRPDDQRLVRIPLYAEPFVAVIPPTHPAAARTTRSSCRCSRPTTG